MSTESREHKVDAKQVWFFRALTPLHAGAGLGAEHIDLPIQRERPTRFPIVYASGIKGALREEVLKRVCEKLKKDCKSLTPSKLDELVEKYSEDEKFNKFLEDILKDCSNKNNVKEGIKTLAHFFGSQNKRGKFTLTDAKILFFPVRSLKGVFAYVTCPMVLKRFAEDVGKSINNNLLNLLDSLKAEEVLIRNNTLIISENQNNKWVIFEEFKLEVKDANSHLEEILNLLTFSNKTNSNKSDPISNDLKSKISKRMAVVHDDVFTYFVENFTEIVERIRINPETGTVKEGGLWTEENLPAESILYSLYFEEEEFNSKEDATSKEGEIANETIKEVINEKSFSLFLGGDQTVGKGLVKIYKQDLNANKSGG